MRMELLTKKSSERSNLLGLVLGVMSLLALAGSCGKSEHPSKPPPSVSGVKVETVRLVPLEDFYETIGTVRSRISSVLSSKVMGNVTAIHVREGDQVAADQLLLEIDGRDLQAQLAKAQAGLQEAEYAKSEAEQALQAAQAQLTAADAQSGLATATFKRYKTLYDRQSVSPQEYDEIQAKHRSAVAERDRVRKLLEALKAKKAQVGARIDQAKADIAHAEALLGYTKVRSPIAGRVTAKQAEVGQMAVAGMPLLSVEDARQYRLEAVVEESLVGKIHPGDRPLLTIEALGEAEITGTVGEIVPVLDSASRTYVVKVDIPQHAASTDNQNLLRSGLFGKARFVVGQKQAIVLSTDSIVKRGQLVGIYALDDSDIARLRLIKTGRITGGRVEVLAGLNEGDRVVVDGIERVSDGVRVE